MKAEAKQTQIKNNVPFVYSFKVWIIRTIY